MSLIYSQTHFSTRTNANSIENPKNKLIMSDKENPQKPTNQTERPTDGGSTFITLNDETPSTNTTNKN